MGERYLMNVDIENGQKRIWVTFFSVTFDGRPDQRLPKDQVSEIMHRELLSIIRKQLSCETFYRKEVNFWVRSKKVKVDVHQTLLTRRSECL